MTLRRLLVCSVGVSDLQKVLDQQSGSVFPFSEGLLGLCGFGHCFHHLSL